MKAIILAAGKKSRLGDIVRDRPKCLMDIEGNTLLEIQINTLHACNIDDISVVRGYQADKIDIPGLSYFDNPDYAETGTLYSLFRARPALTGPLLILYSDIIYEEQVIRRLIEARKDIAIGVMVDWEEAGASGEELAVENLEMVYFDAENRVRQIGKRLTDEYETRGQFTGMVMTSAWGTDLLTRHYDLLSKLYSGRLEAQPEELRRAWLTDMLQSMTELGVPIHSVIIERGWMEIDTPEEYEKALTDNDFVRRMVKMKTDWGERAKYYDRLEWAAKQDLLQTMVSMAGVKRHERVLDLGTGTGKILSALQEREPGAEYYGIDISPEMMARIAPGHGFRLSVSEMENLGGFVDDYFDAVTARMVFHHSRNPDRAVDEVRRVLKPGGRFIICEGIPPDRYAIAFYESVFRFKENRLTFTGDDLAGLLVRHGFRDVTSRTLVLPGMSMNNWLNNSGLPFRNIDIIRKMHYECDPGIRNSYNMRIGEDDILMDWKFSVVAGIK